MLNLTGCLPLISLGLNAGMVLFYSNMKHFCKSKTQLSPFPFPLISIEILDLTKVDPMEQYNKNEKKYT